jgi:uncharacterized membrane protein
MMDESAFIAALERELEGLEGKDGIIKDCWEHFAAGRAEGRTDAEIAMRLGDPRTIAKD